MSEADAVARITAELEIRNLIAALALLADTGEVDEYVALFTDDAVWEMPSNPKTGVAASTRTGHGEIAAGVRERRAAGVQGPGSATRHVITTIRVDVKSAQDATAEAYFLFYADTAAAPSLRGIGQYRDTYRRMPDGWRVARRVIVVG